MIPTTVHGFTDEEMDTYWKAIKDNSVATGVNINDLVYKFGVEE